MTTDAEIEDDGWLETGGLDITYDDRVYTGRLDKTRDDRVDTGGLDEAHNDRVDTGGLDKTRDDRVDTSGLDRTRDDRVDTGGLDKTRDDRVDTGGLDGTCNGSLEIEEDGRLEVFGGILKWIGGGSGGTSYIKSSLSSLFCSSTTIISLSRCCLAVASSVFCFLVAILLYHITFIFDILW